MAKDKQPECPWALRRVGVFPGIPSNTYWLCQDGNVWHFPSPASPPVNRGPLADFLRQAEDGKVRMRLDP